MEISLLDVILLVPLLLFAINGFTKGIIIELTTLAALVLGLYAAVYFSDYTAEMINNSFEISKSYLTIIAFVITFIIVLVLVLILCKLLESVVNILMLGFLNKLAGAVFGIMKGALLLSVLLFLVNYFDESSTFIKKSAKEKSVLYKNIQPLAPWIYNELNLDKLKEQLPDAKKIIKEKFNK